MPTRRSGTNNVTDGPGGRAPTIRDVSRLAGVSRMTVSRALSSPDLVLPATRERVARAIASLGYVPDRAAGALSTRRTGFIGLILPTLTNANFAGVAHGLTEALRTHAPGPGGFELLIGYTGYSLAEEERQVRAMLTRRPEAMVLTGGLHTRGTVAMLLRAGIPVIEIADLAGQPIDRAIGFSNHAVGRAAARHLLDLGHRRIGALGPGGQGDVRDARGEERLDGFAAELAQAGVPTDLILREGGAPVSYAHGAAALATLLARAPDVRAVFAISDLSAVGALMECRRRGIDVPGALSLIGFGDFEIASEMVPALTTIAVDFPRLGRAAGQTLTAVLTGAAPPGPPIVDVGFRLVVRETTRAAPPVAAAPRRRAARA